MIKYTLIPFLVLLLLAQIASAQPTPAKACADSTPETSSDFPDNSFALYAMARGSGVPASARQAMQRVRGLLEEARQRGDGLSLEQTRFGLEGETRLCLTFATPDAARAAWVQACQFAEDADLVNLVIEPCDK
jgi:hypothetical protein